MSFSISKLDNFAVLSVEELRFGRIFADQYIAEVKSLTSQGYFRIVMDMKMVEYIDSSALGAIVNSLKLLKGAGDIVVCSLSEPVFQLFRLTRINNIFKIFDNLDEAIAYFSK